MLNYNIQEQQQRKLYTSKVYIDILSPPPASDHQDGDQSG